LKNGAEKSSQLSQGPRTERKESPFSSGHRKGGVAGRGVNLPVDIRGVRKAWGKSENTNRAMAEA